jgi:subtilisin family serine protease
VPRDLEHLQLSAWREPLPRRPGGGGGGFARGKDEREAHGRQLVDEAAEIAEDLQARSETAPAGINPKLIFKLRLHRQGDLTEDQLSGMGLRLLARSPDKAIVVFPDEPTLQELRRRLTEYADTSQGHEYAYLDAIESIADLSPEDRVGIRLRNRPLVPEEIASLDIELWHSGSRDQCDAGISEIRNLLDGRGLSMTDSWVGQNLCLMRARVDEDALRELLSVDYVKEIDRRPSPSFEMVDVHRLGTENISPTEPIGDDLVGVLILDSGVMQRHPLIGPALGDAQVFPDSLRERIRGGAEDGDEGSGGHGTAVAGIAIYSDVGKCIETRTFRASALLFSARVTDDRNEYDENELLEHQLENAVDYFLSAYPAIKVVNLSLGDEALVYADDRYQFRLAAAIDEVAYRYRERDVVFVISSGNVRPGNLGLSDEDLYTQYPKYLLDRPECRVVDPATSALAVTVGGLSYGGGRSLNRWAETGTETLIAPEQGLPSPFTRTGWGMNGAVKPDLADYAGTWRFERGRVLDGTHAGVPTTARNFSPPDGALFRTVCGTSFAAPRVANLAASLFREFPDASSNLIRALMADSARIPDVRPESLSRQKPWDEDILRLYGHGQPDFERARWSAGNAVLLLAEDTIEVDQFRLFTVPQLPPEFLAAAGGAAHISVTLAYDPPTRHTRADYYLGITMGFDLFRNATPEAVADAIRAWAKEEKEIAGKDLPNKRALRSGSGLPTDIDLKPGTRRRSKGTLQRGSCNITGHSWQYNGQPLVLAVMCQGNRWLPADIADQRFAVIVSLRHDNTNVDIYARLQQQARVFQRVRIQVH